jgi:hypothetical protein
MAAIWIEPPQSLDKSQISGLLEVVARNRPHSVAARKAARQWLESPHQLLEIGTTPLARIAPEQEVVRRRGAD